MQDNKYYTPAIEEFYVGFEYEVFYKGEWKKTSVPHHSIGSDFIFEIKDVSHWNTGPKPRVSYLTKEDIEAEGFEFIKRYDGLSGMWREVFRKGDLVLDFYGDQKVLISNGMSYEDYDCYFHGIVKNRSELRKILKMI